MWVEALGCRCGLAAARPPRLSLPRNVVVSEPGDPFPSPLSGWGPGAVTVPAADFAEGRFPPVCVVTGRPAAVNLRQRYATTPSWVAVFFFINLLALLVAIGLNERAATGMLPVCTETAVRMRRRKLAASWTGWLTLAAWGGAIAIAATLGSGGAGRGLAIGLAALGGLTCIGYLVASSLRGSLMGVRRRVVEDGSVGSGCRSSASTRRSPRPSPAICRCAADRHHRAAAGWPPLCRTPREPHRPVPVSQRTRPERRSRAAAPRMAGSPASPQARASRRGRQAERPRGSRSGLPSASGPWPSRH